MMEQFQPTGGQALVRFKGVSKIVAVYSRRNQYFVPCRGGFARICGRAGAEHVTSVTGLVVTELDEVES